MQQALWGFCAETPNLSGTLLYVWMCRTLGQSRDFQDIFPIVSTK